MTLTTKQKSKRVMRKMGQWHTLNKVTPDNWFSKWMGFTDTLMRELGFKCEDLGILNKQRGCFWSRCLKFSHAQLGTFSILLKRRRKQLGGHIWIITPLKDQEVSITIDTVSLLRQKYEVECRTRVGNEIIDFIRDSWVKQNDQEVNQDS
jgi:hypothetical protein